ncbi:MAG: flagellar basal body rod protein FlgB [Alphaproteobacteria bacterium]|nr:flagellar basal body rod protein FlgB [Alphaproteobacteria bacterium]
MRPDDVSVLGLLQQNMRYASDRQQVISNNVANANTPGYTPQDISQSEFQRAVESQMRGRRTGNGTLMMSTSQGTHMAGRTDTTAGRAWSTADTPDSETTVNGNSVVLEEQMVRATETRMRYESALSLYQKSIGLLRMAVRPPGG